MPKITPLEAVKDRQGVKVFHLHAPAYLGEGEGFTCHVIAVAGQIIVLEKPFFGAFLHAESLTSGGGMCEECPHPSDWNAEIIAVLLKLQREMAAETNDKN